MTPTQVQNSPKSSKSTKITKLSDFVKNGHFAKIRSFWWFYSNKLPTGNHPIRPPQALLKLQPQNRSDKEAYRLESFSKICHQYISLKMTKMSKLTKLSNFVIFGENVNTLFYVGFRSKPTRNWSPPGNPRKSEISWNLIDVSRVQKVTPLSKSPKSRKSLITFSKLPKRPSRIAALIVKFTK